MTTELNEPIYDNDATVVYGYVYVCDGKPRMSPVHGTVADLKLALKVKEVRRCDMMGRDLFDKQIDENGNIYVYNKDGSLHICDAYGKQL